jgi:mediator of RNA polymerase II transcription subunit 13
MFIFTHRMNHPIKRFKSGDLERYRTSKNAKYDLYAGQSSNDSANLHNASQLGDDVKREMGKYDESRTNANGGKENRSDSEADKNSNSENLFTSEGLQPSYADLNKIFDNSDDNSNDDHVRLLTQNHQNQATKLFFLSDC